MCIEYLFTARAVTTQGYRSSDHQLHLIKISKEVKCTRRRGCQKSSMKMSQQLCFCFQYFLLYSALSWLRSPGISFSISPRVCPAMKHLSPKHSPDLGAFMAMCWCAQHLAIPAGSRMHTAHSSAASCRGGAAPMRLGLLWRGSLVPLGSGWLMP